MMYYTLLTSLPRHGRHYKVKQTPISRIQLEKRFKLLMQNERELLKEIEFLVWQSWFSSNVSLKEIVTRAKKILALEQPFITEILYWYFDIRSLFAALRLHKMQTSPPDIPADFWFGQLTPRLINHWNDTDFGLRSKYPWLLEANKKLLQHEGLAVEDLLLTQIWQHLNAIESQHYFDFEALIIYLLRWNIVQYWSTFNETMAQNRLNELTTKIEQSKETHA